MLYIVTFLLLVSTGCVSMVQTKPNAQYEGTISPSFERIKTQNATLYSELRKLPEVIDGVNSEERNSLDQFVGAYLADKESYGVMLDAFDKVGKPDVRKYNSALQAFYWLFEDGKQGWAKKVVDMYNGRYKPEIQEHKSDFIIDRNNNRYSNLSFLLDRSWASFKNEYALEWFWKLEEAKKVEDSCIIPEVCEKIEKFKKKVIGPTDYALQVAEKHPEAFTYSFQPEMFKEYEAKQRERWNDFSTVINRLNSPELVDKYLKLNVSYNPHFRDSETAKSVFRDKTGNCQGQGRLVLHSLGNAGYSARRLPVVNVTSGLDSAAPAGFDFYHITNIYKDNGKWFILDNAWSRKVKGIHGPFNSVGKIKKWFDRSTNQPSN